MYIITNYKKTPKGIDINGARLYDPSHEYITFQAATEKGWRSKKAIIADFPFIENGIYFSATALELTDEVGAQLVARYGAVKVKVYESPQDRASRSNAAAMVAMTQYLQPDVSNY